MRDGRCASDDLLSFSFFWFCLLVSTYIQGYISVSLYTPIWLIRVFDLSPIHNCVRKNILNFIMSLTYFHDLNISLSCLFTYSCCLLKSLGNWVSSYYTVVLALLVFYFRGSITKDPAMIYHIL